jgi:hypothetical protein
VRRAEDQLSPQTSPVEDPIRVQGGRAFDSYAAQWSTPDAFAGEPTDPLSQMNFMYNNGNAVSYSDPSGFDPLVVNLFGDVYIIYRIVFWDDPGVGRLQEDQYLKNINALDDQYVGGYHVHVTAEAVNDSEKGKIGTTLVHLENPELPEYNRKGGPFANGIQGHGNNLWRMNDGSTDAVWDVRVPTFYDSPAHTAYSQQHETLHNAGANHHPDNAGDVMAGYGGEHSAFRISIDDVKDILTAAHQL